MQLPVVSTRVSGIPELVEEGVNGMLVQPREPEALADALQRLLVDPGLRRRLGAEGCRRVRENFDLSRNTQALAELFRGCLQARVPLASPLRGTPALAGGQAKHPGSAVSAFVASNTDSWSAS